MSKYSITDKLSAIDRVLNEGMSCNASPRILGTVKSVVQKWVRIYKLHGEKGYPKNIYIILEFSKKMEPVRKSL